MFEKIERLTNGIINYYYFCLIHKTKAIVEALMKIDAIIEINLTDAKILDANLNVFSRIYSLHSNCY